MSKLLSANLFKKKALIYSALIVLTFSLIIPFVATKPTQAASNTSKERRIVAAFGYCIVNSVNKNDDQYTSWDDLFDDKGSLDFAVVGLDVDSTNGVWSCLETIEGNSDFQGAAALLDEAGLLNDYSDVASRNTLDNKLEFTIFGETFREAGEDGIEDGKAKDAMKNFAATVIQPYLDARLITDEEMADRMLLLADTCYYYGDREISGFEFKATDANNKEVWAEKESYDGGKIIITEISGNSNSGIGTTSAELGNIDLGWDVGSDGQGDFGTNSDWFPLGHDFYNFSNRKDNTSYFGENYTHFNSVTDCNSLGRVKDKVFPYYSISADGETLTLSNGTTADQIREEGSIDLEFTAGGPDNPTCESEGLSLSWLFCPIVNGALNSMDWLFRQFIEPFLVTQPLSSSDDSQNYVYKVWQSFRTLGNIVLVFTLMFIVFGQAIGGGLVDAYTAKKAMPRVLIAAIMINLSFFGAALLVDIFNVLGNGIGQIITAPLNGTGSFSFQPNGFISSTGLLAVVLGGSWVISLVTSSGFLPLLFITVLLPMLLVTIGIFGTLIVRRGLIIMLVIISPIAAALFVLPNTEKYAKQWLNLFIKTMVVYPIIMAIFGVADLMATIFFNASSGSGVQNSLQQFVGLIVLFVPFFMIPFAFKLAGGAIGTVSSAVTGMGKRRLETYKGNELDKNSRISQAKALRESKGKDRYAEKQDHFKGYAASAKLPGGKLANKARMATFRLRQGRQGSNPNAINPYGGVGASEYIIPRPPGGPPPGGPQPPPLSGGPNTPPPPPPAGTPPSTNPLLPPLPNGSGGPPPPPPAGTPPFGGPQPPPLSGRVVPPVPQDPVKIQQPKEQQDNSPTPRPVTQTEAETAKKRMAERDNEAEARERSKTGDASPLKPVPWTPTPKPGEKIDPSPPT